MIGVWPPGLYNAHDNFITLTSDDDMFVFVPPSCPVISSPDNSWQTACPTLRDTPGLSSQSPVSPPPLTMSLMTCSICAETITDRAMKAGGKLYHEEPCFTCTQCGLSLAGAEVAIYTKEESLYCQDCYMSLFVPVCAKCNQHITQVSPSQSVL